MDAAYTENRLPNTEEPSPKSIYNLAKDSDIESKGNSDNKHEKETTQEVPVTQKECIEILKVEVIPRREETIIIASEPKNETEPMEKEVSGENLTVYEEHIRSLQESMEDDNGVEKSVNQHNVEDCGNGKTNSEERIENKSENESESNIESSEMETDDKENSGDKSQEPETNALESSKAATTSGLGLLAQYDSDNEDKNSESDSVVEVPISSGQDYRNQVVEIDSDSDSDDSSDSSDIEYLSELRKTIEKRIETVDEEDEEEDEGNGEEGKKKPKQRLKVKGELLLEDLPPIHDLQITVPEDECIEFGKIHSIVDQLVLVTALPNAILLDLDTVIFLEKGQKVLGEVFDVLGQVADPMYCIRFNSNKDIKEKKINIGDVVYVAPKTQYTQYVILSNLMKLKGSDASWENDIEPPPRFLDYSDDEQEQIARRQLRNKDRPIDNDDPTKKARTVDEENVSNDNRSNNNHHNKRNSNRGSSSGQYNASSRLRHSGPQQHHQQRGPNHNRNSWHSNYYPQPYPSHVSANYVMPPVHPAQQYPPHAPMYTMPPMGHNVAYPQPRPTQYGAPPMMHQHPPQLMPNSFSIRPPTLHGPLPPLHPSQYASPPPPPPGSQ
ncbi:uncharacterized protein ACRADG_004143 [Cochliomyia hominivorax]